MRIPTLVALLTAALLIAPVPQAHAASVTEVPAFGSNPGNLKMFRYVPDGLPAGRPLVVVLHGCSQDAGYGTSSGWVSLAERLRFAVVLPQQQSANNLGKCFNWFQAADTTRGQGEVASIASMVTRMKADFGTSTTYATGLSAGGGMTSALLATYPEVFAGGGVVAGLPFGCPVTTVIDAYSCMSPGKDLTARQWGDKVRAASAHRGPWPTMTVWHGTADYTVAVANQREIVEQWTDVHGTDSTADVTDTVAGYPHAVYRDSAGSPVVETHTVTGMGHGQPVDPGTGSQQCGAATAYVLDVNACAAWYLAQQWSL
ncbi:esterase [Saccharothrix sp. ALI-22-I]|uniref:extracellular catalytic domain type 1 short-chain-length polyhydroxyalkanoate depolymerase n=1 Tax=Saccharothrix sp. ALI-22-I TaxID=1933778 RepID=UPI00097CBF37|nr:PHB depolymerase family esterase [Saccharothrix sp. ALI-22-I]ONI91321.1 esterase [Saccharothrix sp. ALI-22-I]